MCVCVPVAFACRRRAAPRRLDWRHYTTAWSTLASWNVYTILYFDTLSILSVYIGLGPNILKSVRLIIGGWLREGHHHLSTFSYYHHYFSFSPLHHCVVLVSPLSGAHNQLAVCKFFFFHSRVSRIRSPGRIIDANRATRGRQSSIEVARWPSCVSSYRPWVYKYSVQCERVRMSVQFVVSVEDMRLAFFVSTLSDIIAGIPKV